MNDDDNVTSSVQAKFDMHRPFAFLIHGFTDFYPGKFLRINDTEWMKHVIMKWAMNGINACAVNWGLISYESFNYFAVSQVSTVRVANYLTRQLLRFEGMGVDLKKVRIAGHSLGAQIAGKVGAKLRKHGRILGSIYGLYYIMLYENVQGHSILEVILQDSIPPVHVSHFPAMCIWTVVWMKLMHWYIISHIYII